MFLRKKTTDPSSLDRSEARGVVFSCALHTVCALVFVCGESSALSLAICFPGGPTGASPASRGASDSSGIWTTGLAGLPGESSSHVSASSSSASTIFFLPSLCVVLSLRIRSEPVTPSVAFLHVPSRHSSSCSKQSWFPFCSYSRSIFALLSPLRYFFSSECGYLVGWDGRFFFLLWLVGRAGQGGASGTQPVKSQGQTLHPKVKCSRKSYCPAVV